MTTDINGSGDSESVKAHRLTDDYPPAYTDFFGSSMPCIFKTGPAWAVRDGLEAQPFIREARPVYHPDKAEAWRAVGQAIWRSLDALAIEWTFVNPLAYANAGEPQPFCPFVVVVGVRPRTVPFARAVEAATAAAAMLHDAGFAGAEVAVVEGQTTRTVARPGRARGPRLLSFDPLLDDIQDLRKVFTSTLGLSIAPLKSPHCGGTGALFYRLGGDDSAKRVALLTCAHVVRPRPGPESEHPNTTTTQSQPRDPEEIISPGSGAYDDALAALAEDIDNQARAIRAWDALLATLGDPLPSEPARVTRRRTELLSSVRGAKERIEQAHALASAVQDRADPGKRVVGSVLHCESTEFSPGPRGFTKDWALIELYEDMIDWSKFRGNQVFVAVTTTASQYGKIMWPQAADSDYPANGLLQARGIVEEAELRAPQHRDAHGQQCLLVLKNGAASGTTFGRANGLESFVRRCTRPPQHGLSDSETTSLEIAVLRYSEDYPAFSEPGDSGSVVLDRTGKIVGVLTGGAGFGNGTTDSESSSSTHVSYMIPYFDIHAQLIAKFPGIQLYPAIERAPLY